MEKIAIVWNGNGSHHSVSLPQEEFISQAVEAGLPEIGFLRLHTPSSIAELADPSWQVRRHYRNLSDDDDQLYETMFVAAEGVLAFFDKDPTDNELLVQAMGNTAEAVDTFIRRLQDNAPPVVHPKDNRVGVYFWTLGPHGPSMRSRRIDAPGWDLINVNYPTAARMPLARLMAVRPPFDSGRLLVMHGKPGTGKTYALRALLRAWRPWCDPHFIVDPEAMFGNAAYLTAAIFDHSHFTYETDENEDPDETLTGGRRWKLLILEDADEFLSSDAKKKTGQGVSRLLNLADGLIGQGLNLLVLLTTNEPLKNLHPAIIRAGRCIVNVEFPPFNREEAGRWLRLQGNDNIASLTGETSLASLYEMQRKMQIVHEATPYAKTGMYL